MMEQGRDGADLNKNIRSKDVVGINQRQHTGKKQIHNRIVQRHLFFYYIFKSMLCTAGKRQQHHYTVNEGKQRFQRAGTQFIAPGCRVMTGCIGKAGAAIEHQRGKQHSRPHRHTNP